MNFCCHSDLKKVAYEKYNEYQPDAFIVEAKAAGAPLIYELRRLGIPVSEYKPNRGNDKVTRVNSVSDIFASGHIWAPKTRWAEEVIGPERAMTTYAFRSLIDAGARVSFGSDWSVAPATPIEGIYAAVTRQTLDGANPGGWVPEQKITVEQALHAYTTEGAYASFEEDIKGTLKPGMLADFVLLDRDLTNIPAESIRDTQILKTVVGGVVVFDRK